MQIKLLIKTGFYSLAILSRIYTRRLENRFICKWNLYRLQHKKLQKEIIDFVCTELGTAGGLGRVKVVLFQLGNMNE